MIDSCTSELSFYVSKISIQWLNLFVDLIDSENLDSIMLNSDKSVAIIVEEKNFIHYFLIWCSIKTFSWFNIPNHQHISTLLENYLSSRHPWDARSLESGEKDKLVTPCLCNLNLWWTSLLWKSQTMTSATCPGNDCSAEAK